MVSRAPTPTAVRPRSLNSLATLALYGLALLVVLCLARNRTICAPQPGALVRSVDPASDVGRKA